MALPRALNTGAPAPNSKRPTAGLGFDSGVSFGSRGVEVGLS